jgi:hypothetical protein
MTKKTAKNTKIDPDCMDISKLDISFTIVSKKQLIAMLAKELANKKTKKKVLEKS